MDPTTKRAAYLAVQETLAPDPFDASPPAHGKRTQPHSELHLAAIYQTPGSLMDAYQHQRWSQHSHVAWDAVKFNN